MSRNEIEKIVEQMINRTERKGKMTQNIIFVPVAFSYKHATTTSGIIKFDKRVVDNTNSFAQWTLT